MQPPDSFVYLVLLFFVPFVLGQEWDSSNFPNPTGNGFRQCNMKTNALICDPDSVLTEAERYRLNHELNQLEARTRQDWGSTFCEKKGITGALAVAKHFRGGTEAAVKAVANEILQKWTLDTQCQKVVVIVMSTEDRKFWVARDDKVPVYANEFTDLFNSQKQLFRQGNYQQGLHNIIQGTWEKALSKQAGGAPSGGGRRPERPEYPDRPVKPEGGGGGGLPNIPIKLIVLLLLVVIPLLLCCCCIYCCCCRNRGGGSAAPQPAHMEAGGFPAAGGYAQGGSGGGAGRSGLGGFLGGLAGSGAASSVMNMIRNKNRGGGGGVPADPAAAGYTPGSPIRHGNDPNPEGKGLYPSVPVKDEGGGGSW